MNARTGREKAERGLVVVVGSLLVAGDLALLLRRVVFITILPGHVGVLYSLLFDGTVTTRIYDEGLAVKLP